MKCEHKDYEIKQVMDFQFCVCKQCGFQWKGNKPSQPVNADAECQYANLCSPSSVKCTEGCHNHPDKQKGDIMSEQRAAERNPFVVEVIHSMGKDISKDVSVSGMFIFTERDLKVGDEMTVCFVMAQGGPVRTVGQVVRKVIDGVGIKFVQSLS